MTTPFQRCWRVCSLLVTAATLSSCTFGPFGQTPARPAPPIPTVAPGAGAAVSATTAPTPSKPPSATLATPTMSIVPSTSSSSPAPAPTATEIIKSVDAQIGDEVGNVAPTDPIRLVFSGPVDHQAVEQSLRVQPPVAGLTAWNGNTLAFAPSKPWPDATLIAVHLTAAAGGGAGSNSSPFDWSFVTRPAFDVVEVSPRDQATDVPRNAVINAVFSRPPDKASVEANFAITPALQGKVQWQGRTMTFVPTKALPAGATFTVVLGAGIHSDAEDALPTPKRWRFTTTTSSSTTGPSRPFVSTIGGHVVFSQVDHPRQLAFQSQGVPSIHLTLYRAPTTDAFIKAFVHPRDDRSPTVDTKSLSLVGGWDAPLTSDPSQLVTVPNADAPGIYYVDESALGPDQPGQFLVVSGRGLLIKQTKGGVLAWLTNLADGTPVSGNSVTVYDAETGDQIQQGTTNADGLFETIVPPKPSPSLGQPPYAPGVVLVAGSGNTLTLSGSDPSFSINGFVGTPVDYATYVTTDRPIYRPGDSVSMWGIVRKDDDAHFSLPGNGVADVRVLGVRGNEAFAAQPQLDGSGVFHLTMPLATDIDTGDYRITVGAGPSSNKTSPTQSTSSFQVAAYRKPAYAVTVQTPPGPFVNGDHVAVDVAARYYSGQAVTGASVTMNVKRVAWYEPFAPGEVYQSDPEESEGPQYRNGACCADVQQLQSALDGQGQATFDVPTNLGAETMSQLYSFEATVTDASRTPVSAVSTALIHRGSVDLYAEPDRYVTISGTQIGTKLTVQDLQGQPQSGAKVTCTMLEQTFEYTQEGDQKGAFPVTHLVEIPAYSFTAITAANGTVGVPVSLFRPAGYHLTCTTPDSRGNVVSRELYLQSVARSGAVQPFTLDSRQMKVTADKRLYAIGDVAHVQVVSPVQDVTALVTVERGKILDRRIVSLHGSSTTVDVPITADDVPNVAVSVSVQGRGMAASASAGIRVPAARNYLAVSITTDHDQYRPGDQAVVTLKATDASGNPAQGSFSLAMVDEGIFALSAYQPPSIKWRFYGPRPVEVLTTASLQASPGSFGVGGRGGGGDGGNDVARTDFPDTAYWNPSVVTGSDGTATMRVKLPDSLTTWRLTANGATNATQVGYVATRVISTLLFQVRPLAPRFVTAGDQPLLGALVVNDTDAAVAATVTLSGTGFATSDTPSQRISIPPRSTKPLYWTVHALAANSLSLTLEASAGPLSDKATVKLPVAPGGMLATVSKTGFVQASTTTGQWSLPADAIPGTATVDLSVTPSLAGGAEHGVEGLLSYPYDCAEQTVSSLLPAVLLNQAYAKVGRTPPSGLQADVDARSAAVLQRLPMLQHPDGGWNWWSYDQTDPYMTAYVVYALSRMKIGPPVPPDWYARGLASLSTQLTSPSAGIATRAYMLWVLAVAGKPDTARAESLVAQTDSMAYYGLAYLAQALELGGDDQKARAVLAKLAAGVTETESAAVWHERLSPNDLPPMRGSDTYTTAAALEAYAALAPSDPLAIKAARTLLANRVGSGWSTTHDSAMASIALTDFLVAHGDLAAAQHYQAYWNDRLLTDTHVTPGGDSAGPTTLRIASGDIQAHNSLRIVSDGTSPLFWSAALRYRTPSATANPTRGLSVTRKYIAASGSQVTGAMKLGEMIRVRLTIQSATPLDYVLLTDQLPAGLEPVDPSLATTQALPPNAPNEPVTPSRVSLRDTGADIFVTKLPAGPHTLTYYAQAVTPGSFQAAPALVSQMYQPSVTSTSDAETVSVANP